ncbi:hypothetical protein [Caballeronia sp. LjRoot31]|uniref:hypothetical protein n=1 Tax=Caballeronia sp. LjRoot31 TaxID=3342324 RepID=UPI003ED10A3C
MNDLTAPQNEPGKSEALTTLSNLAAAAHLETGGDFLAEVAQRVQTANETQAWKYTDALFFAAKKNYLESGAWLAKIQDEKWYKIEGYGSYFDFIGCKYGMKERRVAEMMATYRAVRDSGVAWSKIQNVKQSKLILLARVLTKDTAEFWVDLAKILDYSALKARVQSEVEKTENDAIDVVDTFTPAPQAQAADVFTQDKAYADPDDDEADEIPYLSQPDEEDEEETAPVVLTLAERCMPLINLMKDYGARNSRDCLYAAFPGFLSDPDFTQDWGTPNDDEDQGDEGKGESDAAL